MVPHFRPLLFDCKERRRREEFELLLDEALYLLLGMGDKPSTLTEDIPDVMGDKPSTLTKDIPEVTYLRQCIHWTSSVCSRSSNASTLPFFLQKKNFLGLITHGNCFCPSCGKFPHDSRTCLVKHDINALRARSSSTTSCGIQTNRWSTFGFVLMVTLSRRRALPAGSLLGFPRW